MSPMLFNLNVDEQIYTVGMEFFLYVLICTVKNALFKVYCTPLYTALLWCIYNKAKFNKLQVAVTDALRMLPRWMSASQLFVHSGVPTLKRCS